MKKDCYNIRLGDINLEVIGNYTSGELGVIYDSNLEGLPSSPSSFEAIEVKVIDSDVNIIELFSSPQIEEIEELVIEEIEK